MPPWSIYLVGLGDEHKFEHVDIPRDIEYNYVVVPNKVKMVAVGTVVGLLQQIAGLTSIAMKQSLAARDALLRIKEEHTRQIDAKRDEIENLKKLVGVLALGGLLYPTSKMDAVKLKSLPTGFSSEGESSDDDDSRSDGACARGQV
ncbi:hypothetical protein M0R45_030878 [Rubus argutus]|uniref:Uncharacterized protein n=1 Tax=Rubus argutus TaxID=59490 RepID=A0AAW1WED6_RUBAR